MVIIIEPEPNPQYGWENGAEPLFIWCILTIRVSKVEANSFKPFHLLQFRFALDLFIYKAEEQQAHAGHKMITVQHLSNRQVEK